MKIEVLYVPNCPNHAVALERLREVLSPSASETRQRSAGQRCGDGTVAPVSRLTYNSHKRARRGTAKRKNRCVWIHVSAVFGWQWCSFSAGTACRNRKGASRGSVMAGWKTTGASLGAVVTSLLTLGCCLPLPFLGAAGIAGASVFLAGARPWLLGFSIILLGLGFFQVYRGMRCRTRQSKAAMFARSSDSPRGSLLSFLKSLPACLRTFRATNEEKPLHTRGCLRGIVGSRVVFPRR